VTCAPPAQDFVELARIGQESTRFLDWEPSHWAAADFGAELALITFCKLYLGKTHQVRDARDVPRRGMQRVLVQEVPAAGYLLLVKGRDEVQVHDCSDFRTAHSSDI